MVGTSFLELQVLHLLTSSFHLHHSNIISCIQLHNTLHHVPPYFLYNHFVFIFTLLFIHVSLPLITLQSQFYCLFIFAFTAPMIYLSLSSWCSSFKSLPVNQDPLIRMRALKHLKKGLLKIMLILTWTGLCNAPVSSVKLALVLGLKEILTDLIDMQVIHLLFINSKVTVKMS